MKKLSYCLLFTLFIMGCSHKPSVDNIKLAFENTEPNIKNGLFKVLSFEKINAQQGLITGIKFYKVEYKARIEFLNKAWELTPEECKLLSRADVPGDDDYKAWLLSNYSLHLITDSLGLGMPYNIGKKRNVKGTIVFQMTENGWQVTDFSILGD